MFTISAQGLKMTGQGLSNSTSSEGRNTLHLLSPKVLYPISHNRTAQAEGCIRCERSSSGEQAAATGTAHLSHSLREEGCLVSLCLSCAGGTSSFPTEWDSARDCFGLVGCSRKCGWHRTAPVSYRNLLMKGGTGSPVLQVDSPTAPPQQTMDSC